MSRNNQSQSRNSFKAFQSNLYSAYNENKYPMPPTRGLSTNTRSSPNLLAFNNINKNQNTQSYGYQNDKESKASQWGSNFEKLDSKMNIKKIGKTTQMHEFENNSSVKSPNNSKESSNQVHYHNGMQSQAFSKQKLSDFQTKLNAQISNMKENTIFKPKPNQNANSYSPQEYYFTMFSAKNKHRSIGNSQQNSEIKEWERNDNANNVREEQVRDMRNEYNRLRKHMEQMQKQNKKLKQINSKLAKENKNYQSLMKSASLKEGNLRLAEKTQKMEDSLPSIRDDNPDRLELLQQSKDSDLFDLLKRAQSEIISRDKQIQNLQAKIQNQYQSQSVADQNIHEIEALIKKYTNIETDDQTGYAIQTFAKLALRYQSQSNLIKTKLAYIYSQYESALAQFNTLLPIFQDYQAKILEKQVKIDVEVEHTKEVLRRWKQGQQVEKPYNENDEQILKSTNEVWFQQGDTEKQIVNNLAKYDKLHSNPINRLSQAFPLPERSERPNFSFQNGHLPSSQAHQFIDSEPSHNFTFRSNAYKC